ncbi:NlpC/P60 family protein [Nonomuraea jiangxiensis]|uniref:C40 family peptidase n=1 Tax=Nonomuraea jiangxiensis TaxID=633440 RepID=UPI001FE328B7|nr:NlpC/P60 family protein [Nonomuraea jiangxiensis]
MPTRLGRATLTVALALTASLADSGPALADPSPAQARARLVKLNEQADQVVERYNQATETYKKAKKKYDVLNGELGRQGAVADGLRKDLAEVAVNEYQANAYTGWQRFAFHGDPEAALSSLATLEQLAEARAAKVRAFEATTKGLRDRRDNAKRVLAEADGARDKIRGEKTEIDKLIKEQTKLARRLGVFRTGDPDSPGIEYNGPASGNARTALEFAFAQVGKPYRFGGTGPGSFDCSGLTQAAWRAAGVSLPRTTWTQWSWGASRRVPLDAIEPGDLLFSKGLGHMGIYAGDGKMVHAPQTGDVIKVVNLDDYWRNRLVGAIRP